MTIGRLARVGGAVVDLLAGQVITKAGNFQDYTAGPYGAYTGMWGVYVPANDALQFTVGMDVMPARFPAETRFTWDVTPDPDYSGVNGYLHIAYGNYDNSPGTITPRQVDAITDLTVRASWTFTGADTSGLLTECWLATTAAASGDFTKTHEIAFFPRFSPDAITYVQGLPQVGTGSFTDRGGTVWNVVQGVSGVGAVPYLIAYRPGFAAYQGPLRFKDLLAFLKTSGKITGSEWFNGVAFGVEPRQGASSLRIHGLSIQYD